MSFDDDFSLDSFDEFEDSDDLNSPGGAGNPMAGNKEYNAGPGYDSPFMRGYNPESNTLGDTGPATLESNDELMAKNSGESSEGKGFRNIAITAAVLCLMAVVLLLTVNWFFSKPKTTTTKVEQPVVQQQQTQTQTTEEKTTTNVVEKELNMDYSTLKEDETQSTTVNNSLVEVTKMPDFSNILSAKGMVISKGMVDVTGKNTFIPYLTITIAGNEKTTDIIYYCNGATYEAVRIGETLDVDYRVDTDYKIVIQQVSTQ